MSRNPNSASRARTEWPRLSEIVATHARIAEQTEVTPVLTSSRLDERLGTNVHLKAEHLQRSGSFKWRGALASCLALPRDQRRRGVIAASSGNHALAVAEVGQLLQMPVCAVVPRDAPTAKLAALHAAGAEIVPYDRAAEDREALASGLAAEHGLTQIPSSDHPAVVSGQATVALELLEQLPSVTTIVVPIGGGGLAAGSILATRGLDGVRVIGVEPRNGDDTRRSLAAGARRTIPPPVTLADGLTHCCPGPYTFGILRQHLAEVVLVDDEDILSTMRLLHQTLGAVAEPSGACALAAVAAGSIPPTDGPVAVVVTGGNIDPRTFQALTAIDPTITASGQDDLAAKGTHA